MNRIFKVVLDHSGNAAVTSELSKAKGKGVSSNVVKALTVGAGMALAGSAMAATSVTATNSDADFLVTTADGQILLGNGAKTNVKDDIAVGTGASATGLSDNTAIAIGKGAIAQSTNIGPTVAVGQGATAASGASIALGNNAQANGQYTTALGQGSVAGGKNMAVRISDIDATARAPGIAGGAIVEVLKETVNDKAEYVYYYNGGRYVVSTNAEPAWYGVTHYGTALGELAKATGQTSVAIGSRAQATTWAATAIGPSSVAKGFWSTAIGRTATVESGASHSVAIGVGSKANMTASHSVAIGASSNALANNTVAIGNATKVSGAYSAAIGSNANVTGNYTNVLGSNVTVTTDHSVVLGDASAESKIQDAKSADVNGIVYSGFKGVLDHTNLDLEGRYVSVGSAGAERQVKNVAAGVISAESTDAINGSQLYFALSQAGFKSTPSVTDTGSTGNVSNIITYTDPNGNIINIDDDGNKTYTDKDGNPITDPDLQTALSNGAANQLVNLGDSITVNAGNNINVTRKVTNDGVEYTVATSMAPTFNTVNVSNNVTSTDENGKPVTKNYAVNFTTGEGVATNNYVTKDGKPVAADTKITPTALNVSSANGNPSQITGVASSLNLTNQTTAPNGTGSTDTSPLVDLANATTSQLNSVATVRDLANMGWVVAATDNAYSDTVKNANKVEFDGEGKISVTGTTTADGVRKITVKLADDVLTSDKVTSTKINTAPTTGTDAGKVSVANATAAANTPATAQNVVEAINSAFWSVNSAKVAGSTGTLVEGSDTASSPVKAGSTVNVNAGNNIAIKRNGNTLEIATNENVTFNNVTADKIIFEGNPNATVSYNATAGGIDFNGNKLTNVAPATKAGEVVTFEQLKANEVTVKAGTGTNVTTTTNANGGTDYNVAVNTATLNLNEDGSISFGGASNNANGSNSFVTADQIITAINQSGWSSAESKAAGTVASKVENVDESGKAVSGSSRVKAGSKVAINAGNNVEVKRQVNKTTGDVNYTIATSMTPEFENVTIGNGDQAVKLASKLANDGTTELSVANKAGKSSRITNVADGVNEGDAVNVRQLNNVRDRLDGKINRVNKEARAGIAGAAAIAGLPEIHLAGHSMMSVAGSTYKNENAVAVGYSRLSDNSKVKLKLSGSANTRGDFIGTVGVGFAW